MRPLSAIVVELAGAVPVISSCKPAGPALLRANATAQQSQQQNSGEMVLDESQERALLKEARSTIVTARGLLAM